jgi:hypothetical protein
MVDFWLVHKNSHIVVSVSAAESASWVSLVCVCVCVCVYVLRNMMMSGLSISEIGVKVSGLDKWAWERCRMKA